MMRMFSLRSILLVLGIVLIVTGVLLTVGSLTRADYTENRYEDDFDPLKYDDGDVYTVLHDDIDEDDADMYNALVDYGLLEGETVEEGDDVIITYEIEETMYSGYKQQVYMPVRIEKAANYTIFGIVCVIVGILLVLVGMFPKLFKRSK